MDGHAVATGDEAHDVISGDGGAAFGELHQTVVQTFHDNALLALDGLGLLGSVRRLGVLLGLRHSLCQHLLLLPLLLAALQLALDPAHRLLSGEAAIADGSVEIVQRGISYLFQQHRQEFRVQYVFHGDAAVTQLRVEGGAAVGDVLVPLFLFEPLADLGAGLVALGNLHPVPAGALGVFGGQNLHDVAVFQHMVQRDDAVIHLGADHAVAHGGMDGVGEVDGGGSGGEVLHVAVGGEHEHLVGEHIHLQGVDKLLSIGTFLIFQQAAYPLVLALGAGTLTVLLILPVGGHAVLGDLVHLRGADLHLKGDALVAHDGGVKALVAVGLGGADIVLEASQNGLVEVMDHAQHVVAVADGVYHHPERKEVENLIQRFVLAEHFPVDGIRVLHAAVDNVLDAHFIEPLIDLSLGAAHESVILRALGVQLGDDLIVADGVQIF